MPICMRVLAVLLWFFVAGSALAGRNPPPGQCDELVDSNRLRDALESAVNCNDQRLLYGESAECTVTRGPRCARGLVADAMALTYGSPIAAPGPVELPAHQPQLDCQQQLGTAASDYTWDRLHQRILGSTPEEADAHARAVVDQIAVACQLDVVQDASGVVLPSVGPQCAAAVGAPGTPVDADALRDCTHALLQRWAEGLAPDPQLPRPNILFIMTDDQRYDMVRGEHAPPGEVIMPSVIAEIAAQGVEFTSAAVPTPLCSPSRASVLSGQYATHNTVYGANSQEYGATQLDDTSTVATWLDAAGYRTAHIGKYLNGYAALWTGGVPYIPPGWDEWTTFRNKGYYEYSLVEDGVVVNYGFSEEEYSTDVLRDKALAFIDEAVAGGEPFYLHWVPFAPHSPFTPPLRHRSLFPGLAPFRPPSFNEADVSDKPWYVSGRPLLSEFTMDSIRLRQLRSLQAVDEAVAALVQRLRDHGILDDTLIVFTSDHGYLLGEHRLQAKYNPYEEATRVPLIIRYPALAPLPRTDDRPVLNIDFASTFAELAGAQVDIPQDGSSLVPVLEGRATSWRSDFFTEGWPPGKEWVSVRESDWVYMEYAKSSTPPSIQEAELYDLANDPFQLENLANDPAHANRMLDMSNRLLQFRPLWPADMLFP